MKNQAIPIPNDPLSRYWVDVSNANPAEVDRFRSSLVTLLAFDHSQVPSAAGTGFFIAAATSASFAFVISAKHVIEEIHKIQRPVPRYALSSLFVPASLKNPSIGQQKFRAAWAGSESADLLITQHVSYNNSLDIACCIFAPQKEFGASFKPAVIPIDTTIPSVGDVVHMISQGGLRLDNFSPPTNRGELPKKFEMTRSVNIRIGTVTGIYPKGFRQYGWPCSTTSIPAEPGMSGGFVYLPRDGMTIAACGIVCADNSEPEDSTNFHKCGESVIGCAWTALSLVAPKYAANDSPMQTLYDMMKAGAMPEAIGGIDHIHLIDSGNSDYLIVYGET